MKEDLMNDEGKTSNYAPNTGSNDKDKVTMEAIRKALTPYFRNLLILHPLRKEDIDETKRKILADVKSLLGREFDPKDVEEVFDRIKNELIS